MDDTAFAGILSRSLALIEAGEDLDSVTGRYPEVADSLSELLKTAHDLGAAAPHAVEVPHDFLRNLGEQLRA